MTYTTPLLSGILQGPDADHIIVYAKTEPDKGSKGITAFIVDSTSDGFSCARKLDKLGMRGSNTGELVFEDVFVPQENMLGELNHGVRVLMEGLDIERLVLSAGPLGYIPPPASPQLIPKCYLLQTPILTINFYHSIMSASLALTLPYTHTRTQFSLPIAHNQLLQAKLADMYTKYRASSSYTYAVAASLDTSHHTPNNLPNTKDCAGVILYAAERATECALDAIQLMGGMGYVNEVPAGRLLRDAKLYEIGAGTSEVRRIVIGRCFNREWAVR